MCVICFHVEYLLSGPLEWSFWRLSLDLNKRRTKSTSINLYIRRIWWRFWDSFSHFRVEMLLHVSHYNRWVSLTFKLIKWKWEIHIRFINWSSAETECVSNMISCPSLATRVFLNTKPITLCTIRKMPLLLCLFASRFARALINFESQHKVSLPVSSCWYLRSFASFRLFYVNFRSLFLGMSSCRTLASSYGNQLENILTVIDWRTKVNEQ